MRLETVHVEDPFGKSGPIYLLRMLLLMPWADIYTQQNITHQLHRE